MKKRLTEAQFQTAIKGLEIGQQTLDIARGVLVDGRPQAEFVTSLGLTKGAVSQAVSRVWAAAGEQLP
ncbi:transcriptional regulator KorA, partial [Paenibacillus polymyxa]|nr:transcriptional regulator KorA [Paenibacillus polymyxa]